MKISSNKLILSYAILGIMGLVILVSLGVWQIQRSQWKEMLIQRLEESYRAEPVPIEKVIASDYQKHIFFPVTIEGTWGTGPNFFIMGKTHKRRPGYHLLNIVTLPNGEHLLVNFGWIQHKNILLRGHFPDKFKGRIRVPESKKWYMPDNKPGEQEWGSIDIPEMEKATGIKLLPYYVDHVRIDTGRAPHPVPQEITLQNNHMGYAVTWISLAVIWGTVVLILIIRTRRQNKQEETLLHQDETPPK